VDPDQTPAGAQEQMTDDQAGALTGASLRGTVALQHSRTVFDAAVQTFASVCGVHLRAVDRSYGSFGAGVASVTCMSGGVMWSAFVGLPDGTAREAAARVTGRHTGEDKSTADEAVARLGNIISTQVGALLATIDVTADVMLPAMCHIDNFPGFVRRYDMGDFRCFSSEMGDVWVGVIAGL